MTAHKNKTKTTQMTQNHSDFSIDHILNKAGSSSSSVNTSSQNLPTSSDFTLDHYSWLHCTRYCPPKVSSEFFLSIIFIWSNRNMQEIKNVVVLKRDS